MPREPARPASQHEAYGSNAGDGTGGETAAIGHRRSAAGMGRRDLARSLGGRGGQGAS